MMDLTPEREHRSYPKGPTRKQIKARADRAEAKVKKSVRQQCVDREGWCRMTAYFAAAIDVRLLFDPCEGPEEWAHMHKKRRSQTRGQAPEVRHTTKDSLMLCRYHHQEYDAHRLRITALTRQGADGPLKFTRAKA